MANLVLVVLFTCCTIVIREVQTESILEILFSKLSDRIDNLDRAFETKLDNSVAEINNRLNKIEKVIGIKEHDSEDDDVDVLRGIRNGQSMWADIRNAKHTFMKAMVTEKKHLMKFATEYEKKFDQLKHDVKDVLSGMNDTLTESNASLVGIVAQNKHMVNEQIGDVLSKIHSVTSNATLERDDLLSKTLILEDRVLTIEINQTIQDEAIRVLDVREQSKNREQDSTIDMLDSRVASFNSSTNSERSSLYSQQSSNVRSLESRVTTIQRSANSERSSLSSRISSLYDRVSTLHEPKVGFTVELSSVRAYSKGSVLVFDREVYNYDDNYDTTSGKFTAPKSGTYLFSMSVEGTRNGAANVVFKTSYKSKPYIRRSAYAGKGEGVTGSSTCVVYMSTGQQAWVESFKSGEFLRARTSFTGVLIG